MSSIHSNRSISPVPPNSNGTTNAITQTLTTLATTPQSNLNLPALQSVLNTYPKSSNKTSAQTDFLNNLIANTKSTTNKLLNDTPPFVHLSPKDAAPQLQIDNDKLTVKGAFRGYRMVRGSHGVSTGNWYFEVIVCAPPKVSEVVKALPKNVRMGEVLKNGLREGMVREREEMRKEMVLQRQQQLKQMQLIQQQQQQQQQDKEQQKNTKNADDDTNKNKKRKLDDTITSTTVSAPIVSQTTTTTTNTTIPKRNSAPTPPLSTHAVGGHLRIGWSMRTGELQAPVGYDQWSYGYRSIGGSRIHNSQREDRWGGEGFEPGDVIGFAISLVDESVTSNNTATATINTNIFGGSSMTSNVVGNVATSGSNKTKSSNQPQQTNHIRFFKNGVGQGHFVVSRGVQMGGAAFDNIQKGMYYPAISPYMGGTARVNFGPHFIYPPRGLPKEIKVKPLSDICPAPPTADEVLDMFKQEKVFGKKIDEAVVNILHEAIKVEANMRYECYQQRLENNIMEVRDARTERGLSTSDLPDLKEDVQMEDVNAIQETSN